MNLSIDQDGNVKYKSTFDGHLGRNILKRLKANGDKTLQIEISSGTEESCSSFRLRTIRVAEALRARGLKLGDVVLVCAVNHNDIIIPSISSLYIGTRAMNLYLEMTHDELKYLTERGSPKIVFCDYNKAHTFKKILEEIENDSEIVVFGDNPDNEFTSFSDFLEPTGTEGDFTCVNFDPVTTTAFIVCSSGTTNIPKHVEISHRAMLLTMVLPRLTMATLDISDDIKKTLNDGGRFLNFSPMYWVSGIISMMWSCLGGHTILQSIKPFSCELAKLAIEKYHANTLFLSPISMGCFIKYCETTDIDLSKVYFMMFGGGPVSAEIIKRFQNLLVNGITTNGYGITETGGISLNFDCKNTSTGKISSWIKWRVVDPDTEEVLGANQHGELRVKAPTMFTRYYKDPATTAAAFDDEGYFKTGDKVYFDDEGNFYIVDRLKEMISYQNYHLSTGEIEHVIYRLDGVKAAAVVGAPHPTDREHPMAFVELMPGAKVTAEEIKDIVKNSLSDRKQLKGGVVFLDKMPQTPSGKVNRKVLRELKMTVKGE